MKRQYYVNLGIICGIYKITSPSGKVYIGQSKDIRKRFLKYHSIENTGEQPAISRSFKKYGVDNHIFEVIEECIFEDLNIRERYWQDYYNVLKDGLNCVLTETDELPKVVFQETRDKIGFGNKGKIISEETRLKISTSTKGEKNSKFGVPKTIEQREKISKTLTGRKLSEETKQKMSESRKGVKHFLYGKKMPLEQIAKKIKTQKANYKPENHGMAKKVVNVETGEIFDCAVSAALTINMKPERLTARLRGDVINNTNFKYDERG